jgi:hypothetical protein
MSFPCLYLPNRNMGPTPFYFHFSAVPLPLVVLESLRHFGSASEALTRVPNRFRINFNTVLHFRRIASPLLSHSNLKISTGKIRDADRAGTSVAARLIASAAAAIHNASTPFARKGT